MDPYIANLNFDPPKHSSELAVGLLPALVLNALFFGVVLLGAQPDGLQQPGSDTLSLTREMGGPAAPAEPAPAAAQPPTTAPTEPVRQAPAARAPVTTTQVAKVEAQPAAPRATTPAPREIGRASWRERVVWPV